MAGFSARCAFDKVRFQERGREAGLVETRAQGSRVLGFRGLGFRGLGRVLGLGVIEFWGLGFKEVLKDKYLSTALSYQVDGCSKRSSDYFLLHP